MRVAEQFPSKYLSADDLQGKPAVVRMGECINELLDGKNKMILSFQGRKKTMVLNKTNATKIADIYGEETEDWYDKVIELYTAEVDFQGRTVEAIRVRAPRTETRSNERSEPRREAQREPDRGAERHLERREYTQPTSGPDRGHDRVADDRPRDPPPRRAAPADMDDDIPF
jgi:hypothetical protein